MHVVQYSNSTNPSTWSSIGIKRPLAPGPAFKFTASLHHVEHSNSAPSCTPSSIRIQRPLAPHQVFEFTNPCTSSSIGNQISAVFHPFSVGIQLPLAEQYTKHV